MTCKILVVDKSASMRSFCKILFEDEGYCVHTTDQYNNCLEDVSGGHPEVVLLTMDSQQSCGIKCCKQIKDNKDTRNVKVVMMTTTAGSVKIREAFAAGCDDYLIHPVDRKELLLKVKDLLKFSHLRPSSA